ncbi:MAG: hypothetical protein ABIT10_07370 [Alteraurantiacibacter sp.]
MPAATVTAEAAGTEWKIGPKWSIATEWKATAETGGTPSDAVGTLLVGGRAVTRRGHDRHEPFGGAAGGIVMVETIVHRS